jgi:hypothetical protein
VRREDHDHTVEAHVTRPHRARCDRSTRVSEPCPQPGTVGWIGEAPRPAGRAKRQRRLSARYLFYSPPSPSRSPGCGGGFWQKRRPLLCFLSFTFGWTFQKDGRAATSKTLVGQKAAVVTRPATRRCVPVRFLARRCNESIGRKKLSLPCRQGKEAPQRRFII